MEREKQKQLEREQQTKQSSNKWSDDESDKTNRIISKTQISGNCVSIKNCKITYFCIEYFKIKTGRRRKFR